jgi:hypothetical protein
VGTTHHFCDPVSLDQITIETGSKRPAILEQMKDMKKVLLLEILAEVSLGISNPLLNNS